MLSCIEFFGREYRPLRLTNCTTRNLDLLEGTLLVFASPCFISTDPPSSSQRHRMAQQHSRGWPSAPFTLSIADAYFFEELSAALSHTQATHWLAHHANCKQRSRANSLAGSATPVLSCLQLEAAGSAMCSPLPAERNSWRTVQAEISGLALELGADRGLLYTDAAHRVLDVSPRSSRKAVDTEAGGAKQILSLGFRNQDVSGHHPSLGQKQEVNA